MEISTIVRRHRASSGAVRNLFLVVAIIVVANFSQIANAQDTSANDKKAQDPAVEATVGETTARDDMAKPHKLRKRGKTLIEGEDFSEMSDSRYRLEESKWCSGNENIGYFWQHSWVELKVDVPEMLNYTLSVQTASEKGTQLAVLLIDGNAEENLLTKIDVPKTETWHQYASTKDVTISLPPGVQTLRFLNLVDGANIDYFTFSAGDRDDVVTTHLAANAGPDINPLKGFNSGWWRPDDDYASVGFQYIEWGKLEPEDDVFNWDNVEEVLNRPGSKGRHFILQFAVDWDDWNKKKPEGDSHYKGPDWLLRKVRENRGRAYPDDPNSRISRATRYNDPVFIAEATEAIEALVDHYKDDPRTFVIQVGVLGYWGEWHTFPRDDWSPTDATKIAILEAYRKSLSKDGLTQVRYPDEPVATPRPGMGYTNGSATLTDHGREFGDVIEKGELWKNGPVGGEWPPSVEPKHWRDFFLSEKGLAFINQARYSTLLMPEAKEIKQKLPSWNPNGWFMKMHRQFGYNFQVKTVSHLASVDAAKQTHIEVDLHNAGIAPFYKNWDVQLAVLKTKSSEVHELIETDFDLRKLGPGETNHIVATTTKKLDPRVDYQIGIRILQPGADKTKPASWNLDARNTYVVLANDVKVTKGEWKLDDSLKEEQALKSGKVLRGGWNILDDFQHRLPETTQKIGGKFFPLDGSFRPTESNK